MPLVVKPIDSAGSRGISLCADRARLPSAIEAALSMSRRHTAVLEEHVDGSHHTLEAFFTDGQLTFAAITTRTITEPPHLVTTSHRVPSGLNEEIECRILDATRTVCAMLGVRTGPIDVDVIVESDGTVHLIEFGARVGGSGLTELIRHAYGVDVVEASIDAAFGLPVDLQPLRERRCGALSILRSERDGVLAAIRGEDEVRQTPELAELYLVATPGHEVHAYRYAAAKLGYAVLVADSEAVLAEALASLRQRLTFTIAEAVDHEREGVGRPCRQRKPGRAASSGVCCSP
jgi:biotin carboxylase